MISLGNFDQKVMEKNRIFFTKYLLYDNIINVSRIYLFWNKLYNLDHWSIVNIDESNNMYGI